MGTNYYVKKNHCDSCDRYDTIHIGKSSYGWVFMFRAHEDIPLLSWKQWKEYLKGSKIQDEYGAPVDYEWFVKFVENEKSPNYVLDNGFKNRRTPNPSDEDQDPSFDLPVWVDDEGYLVNFVEFS